MIFRGFGSDMRDFQSSIGLSESLDHIRAVGQKHGVDLGDRAKNNPNAILGSLYTVPEF
jgi:hypothetical protein